MYQLSKSWAGPSTSTEKSQQKDSENDTPRISLLKLYRASFFLFPFSFIEIQVKDYIKSSVLFAKKLITNFPLPSEYVFKQIKDNELQIFSKYTILKPPGHLFFGPWPQIGSISLDTSLQPNQIYYLFVSLK